MSTKTVAVLAVALCVTSVRGASGQQPADPITKSTSISATATILAIDRTARTITLRDQKGQTDTYSVGPVVQRFDELKVGDTVRLTYRESIVLQVRPAGGAPGPTTTETGVTPRKGPLPSGTIAVQDRMTVTVKAIDPVAPSVTVATPDGRTVTRKVENKKNIEGLKVGDLIDIVYSLALVTNIERAN
jgi:hypothetical protein